MHVLIIESDSSFAASLDDALRARGVGTTVTADGEAALALARSQRPAAVVLSLELGERLSAGFSWCNRFKRDEGLRSIPLILTSSLATEETFEHHGRLRTRADRYLHKPFPPETLIGELTSLLALDGPPAGSDEGLADELLQIVPDELITLEADEITEIPIDEAFSPGPVGAVSPDTLFAPTEAPAEGVSPAEEETLGLTPDDFDLPSIPEEELSSIPVEDEGLDDLFADLAEPLLPDPEKTVTELVFGLDDGEEEPAAAPSLDPAAPEGSETRAPDLELQRLEDELRQQSARFETERTRFETERTRLTGDLDRALADAESARRALHEAHQQNDRLSAEMAALEEQLRSRAEAHQADLQQREELKELLHRALQLL